MRIFVCDRDILHFKFGTVPEQALRQTVPSQRDSDSLFTLIGRGCCDVVRVLRVDLVVAGGKEGITRSVTDGLWILAPEVCDLPDVGRGDSVAPPHGHVVLVELRAEVTGRGGRRGSPAEVQRPDGCSLSDKERLDLLIVRGRSGDYAAKYERSNEESGESSEHGDVTLEMSEAV